MKCRRYPVNEPEGLVSWMADKEDGSQPTVSQSAYRQPVTPEGLKAIETGTLTWLDDEMYNNLNTGVLEQYLDLIFVYEKISSLL